MRNLALKILETAALHPERPALCHQRDGVWREWNYAETARLIERAAAALVELGVAAGDRVGIFSPNLPQWLLADYAALSIRAVTVPIYATNTAAQVRAIVADSGLKVLCVGNPDLLATAREATAECPAVERLILLDDAAGPAQDGVLGWSDLLAGDPRPETRDEIELRRAQAEPGDLATLIYTSGTTGDPKGVLLEHGNFRNQLTAVDARFDIDETDRSLCFLPLSHVYERTWSGYVLATGACNYILSNPRQVVQALAEVRPTIMVSAPRLYEKAHSAVLARVDRAPRWRQRVFAWALRTGTAYWRAVRAGRRPGPRLAAAYAVADKLALRKVRDAMGGPKKCLSSGGAPLAREVEEFFFSIGLLISQGYGLTETAPMCTCNAPADYKLGSVGKPIDEVEIRIGPEGEVEVRGPNVTRGYYNNPAATVEAFREGWFRTGDVGHLDPDGFLVITDRIKDLIITAGGKNVAPQRIETLVGRDHFIDQLAVVGDRRKFISAIIVPAFEALSEFAVEKKLQFSSHEDLVKLPEVIDLYTNRIREHSQQLAPFERIRRFTLVAKQFSQQAGEITPTLKVRRQVVAQRYAELIESMYGADPSF